jgi:dTDP-4-amino-4,6-dideoxygalactose transaminase
VDIDPKTFLLDASLLEDAITPQTKAVIAVHLYGHPADMPRILEIAGRRGIRVIEDCAQAHGAKLNGRCVGGWGDLAGFSFYPTKNLGAFGDGGMVVSNDPALAERVRLLREYGWRRRYVSEVPGTNSRLDELQAAILRVKLRHLDGDTERRRELAAAYTRALEASGLKVPSEQSGARHVFHLYVVRHLQRDALRRHLQGHGIETAVHYPVPVHLQAAYRREKMECCPLPQSERAAEEVLSLPLYPELAGEAVERVARAIVEWSAAPAPRE